MERNRHALTTLVELPQGAIYRESHGEGIQKVTLEGTFGVQARLINGTEMTGTQIFKTLEDLIGDYWERLKKDTSIHVEYHDHGRDKHHYAEIMGFNTPIGHENRLHDRYLLDLQLYAEIKQELKEIQPDKLQAARKSLGLLQKALAFLKKIEKKTRSITAKASEILNRSILQPMAALSRELSGFVSGVTDLVLFPLRALNRMSNAVADFFSSVGTIAGDSVTALANTLRQTRRTLNRLMRFPDLFKPTLGAIDELNSAATDLCWTGTGRRWIPCCHLRHRDSGDLLWRFNCKVLGRAD